MAKNMLHYWARFSKLTPRQKRDLLTDFISSKTGFSCEAKIYQVLTRLSFRRSHRGRHGAYHKDDLIVKKVIDELGFAASTGVNWYLTTKKEEPLRSNTSNCSTCKFNGICEYQLSQDVLDSLPDKYGLILASKRLKQIVVRKELFVTKVQKVLPDIDDDSLRISLRRLVELRYYETRRKRKIVVLTEVDLKLQGVLQERKITAMCALRWFYLLKNARKRMQQVIREKQDPDLLFDEPAQRMKEVIL